MKTKISFFFIILSVTLLINMNNNIEMNTNVNFIFYEKKITL